MNELESSIALPRMWMAPNYKDPALEAAHRENERLQRVVVLHQLLLDEATSRIGDLAKYQHKAATIVARLSAQIRALRMRQRRERPPTKSADLSIPRSYSSSRIGAIPAYAATVDQALRA